MGSVSGGENENKNKIKRGNELVVVEKGEWKGGNFIYPMMHRFIVYYQPSDRT